MKHMQILRNLLESAFLWAPLRLRHAYFLSAQTTRISVFSWLRMDMASDIDVQSGCDSEPHMCFTKLVQGGSVNARSYSDTDRYRERASPARYMVTFPC